MDRNCNTIMTSELKNTMFNYPYPSRPKAAIFVMLSGFSIFGTLGNLLVLFVFASLKNRLPSSLFIICLASTDLITCSVIIPFTLVMEFVDYFVVYDPICKLYFSLTTCTLPFSAFIMVVIAIDY